jgi:RNA polymerase sigma factor (sigma-70 family)
VNAVTPSWSVTRQRLGADRRSFASVAEEHLDDVYRFLVYLTKDVHTADDLTSETFTRALTTWHRFDERRGSARTWLCQIARSTALDHFRSEERRRRRERAFAATEPVSEQRDPFAGLSPALHRALGELSAADREVIALRVILELDGEAAARVMGIGRTACAMRLSRALQKLEEKVEIDALV